VPDSPRDPRTNDLPEVTTRNRIVRHIVEGYAAQFPADIWQYLAAAFADTPALAAEITRLRAELAETRLDRANLAAAALAATAAHYDGRAAGPGRRAARRRG